MLTIDQGSTETLPTCFDQRFHAAGHACDCRSVN